MLHLTSMSDKLQLVTAQAVTVDVHASWIDYASGTVTIGRTNTAITTATTTDVVGAPAASTQRNVKSVFMRNKHASSSVDVTVQHTDGTTTVEVIKITLSAGDTLEYSDSTGLWKVTNPVNVPVPGTVTADQSIGASVTVYLTGSDLHVSSGRPLKAGSTLRWRVSYTKTAAATAATTFDLRVGTAGTTSDTSRGSIASGTQTAAADVGWLDVVVTIRSISASGTIHVAMATGHNLAATGLDSQAVRATEATSATFDTTATNLIFGISLTTGASHSIAIKQVLAEFIQGTI